MSTNEKNNKRYDKPDNFFSKIVDTSMYDSVTRLKFHLKIVSFFFTSHFCLLLKKSRLGKDQMLG